MSINYQSHVEMAGLWSMPREPELQNLGVPVFYFPRANARLKPRTGIALGSRLEPGSNCTKGE